MIKLSSLLEHILDHPMKGEAIQEAKRLERIDECGQLTHLEITPDVSNTELKPLLTDDSWSQSLVYIVINEDGTYRNTLIVKPEDVKPLRSDCTGRRVVQVMQPDINDNCPTQCVYIPEREHEWVIYRDINGYPSHWFAINGGGDDYWGASPTHAECQRFSTKVLAQNFINSNRIEDAYPWPVPKLSEK